VSGEEPQVSGGLWGRRVSNLRPLACKSSANKERRADQQKRRSRLSENRTVIRCQDSRCACGQDSCDECSSDRAWLWVS
jgi:hypothetical protein